MEWYWWIPIGIFGVWFFVSGVVGGIAEGPGEPMDTTDGYP